MRLGEVWLHRDQRVTIETINYHGINSDHVPASAQGPSSDYWLRVRYERTGMLDPLPVKPTQLRDASYA